MNSHQRRKYNRRKIFSVRKWKVDYSAETETQIGLDVESFVDMFLTQSNPQCGEFTDVFPSKPEGLHVLKKDGNTEPFDFEKLKTCMKIAVDEDDSLSIEAIQNLSSFAALRGLSENGLMKDTVRMVEQLPKMLNLNT